MKKNKEAMDLMRKAMAMMEDDNYPSGEEQMYEAKSVQNAMDMGMQSPNAPNGEDDAINKDEGGFKNAQSAGGGGQSDEEKKKLAKAAFIAMMKKGG